MMTDVSDLSLLLGHPSSRGLIATFVLVLGLLIGSFLNVVIYRLPRRESLWKPGSHCPACQHSIRWFENIPLVSFILLKGKCGGCAQPISPRYPLVELLTGLLFLAAYLFKGWSWVLWIRDIPFLALMIVVTFIDLDHRIIPDRLNLLGVLLGLLTAALDPHLGVTGSLLGALGGFGIFYGFAWLYWSMTARSGLGGGDIKFLAVLGAFLGLTGVFTVILLSSVLGSALGLLLGWTQKKSGETESVLKVALPYGPFLVIGALVAYFFQESLAEILWLPFMNPM